MGRTGTGTLYYFNLEGAAVAVAVVRELYAYMNINLFVQHMHTKVPSKNLHLALLSLVAASSSSHPC